jgi:hypothetical protein
LLNYFKTSRILRRYAPGAAAALLAFVPLSRKSAARPFLSIPHVPDHPTSSRFETDPVIDFLKTIILNVGQRCHQPFYLKMVKQLF